MFLNVLFREGEIRSGLISEADILCCFIYVDRALWCFSSDKVFPHAIFIEAELYSALFNGRDLWRLNETGNPGSLT